MSIVIALVVLLLAFVFLAIGLTSGGNQPSIMDQVRAKSKKRSIFYTLFGVLAPINIPLLHFLKLKKRLQNKLDIAQWTGTPEEIFSAKELLAIIFPIFLYTVFDLEKAMYLGIATLVGFILPDMMLNSAVKKRKFEIVRRLPETVDLLTLCVGAGLDFMSAVRWIIEKARVNAMIEELARVQEEINLGKLRGQALRDMSKRLDIADLYSFTRTLIQADKMGTPIEDTLTIISEDMRMRRFQRGQRQAMKAPIKILIPLIVCILPIILIIVGGPVLIRFMKGGIGGMG